MILAPLQKLPNNVGNLGKIILATIFKWLPKVQKTHCPPYSYTYSNIASEYSLDKVYRAKIYFYLFRSFLLKRENILQASVSAYNICTFYLKQV